jgi:hypothetical protein
VLGELTYAEGCLSSRDEVLNCPYTIVGKIAMVGHCVKPGPVRRRFSGRVCVGDRHISLNSRLTRPSLVIFVEERGRALLDCSHIAERRQTEA